MHGSTPMIDTPIDLIANSLGNVIVLGTTGQVNTGAGPAGDMKRLITKINIDGSIAWSVQKKGTYSISSDTVNNPIKMFYNELPNTLTVYGNVENNYSAVDPHVLVINATNGVVSLDKTLDYSISGVSFGTVRDVNREGRFTYLLLDGFLPGSYGFYVLKLNQYNNEV